MHAFVTAALGLWAAAYAWLVTSTFLGDTAARVEQLTSEGRIEPAYAEYILRIPAWVIGLSLLLAGLRLGGAGALALRSPWASPVYAAALVLTAVVMVRGFVFERVAGVIRPTQIGVEIAFIAISIFAWWYARRMST